MLAQTDIHEQGQYVIELLKIKWTDKTGMQPALAITDFIKLSQFQAISIGKQN